MAKKTFCNFDCCRDYSSLRFSVIRKLDKLPEIAHHKVSIHAKVQPGEVGRVLLQFVVHYDDYKTLQQERESSSSLSKGSGEDD